jgi:hypothetical protein
MAVLQLGPRTRLGPFTAHPPSIRATGITLPALRAVQAWAPYPDVTSTIVFTAGEFGLTAATATTAQVTITHRVSDPAAFASVTGQLYASGSPVGQPQPMTLSATYVQDVITTSGATISPSALASLQLRVTWQSVALGIVMPSWSLARAPAATAARTTGAIIAAGII